MGGACGFEQDLSRGLGQSPVDGRRAGESRQALPFRPDAEAVEGELLGRPQAAPADGALSVELDLPVDAVRADGPPLIALDDLEDAEKGIEAAQRIAPGQGHESAASSFARNWSMS